MSSHAFSAVCSSPFSFRDPALEQRYLDGAYASVATATQCILTIELIIHLILVGDILRVARGRPVLEAQLCLFVGISAMLAGLLLLSRAPAVLRLYRIPINCCYRVLLTVGYTQVSRHPPPLFGWGGVGVPCCIAGGGRILGPVKVGSVSLLRVVGAMASSLSNNSICFVPRLANNRKLVNLRDEQHLNSWAWHGNDLHHSIVSLSAPITQSPLVTNDVGRCLIKRKPRRACHHKRMGVEGGGGTRTERKWGR